MDKRVYYQQKDVVESYEDWRFGSPGGAYVDQHEKDQVLGLLGNLDRRLPVLDLPCGTGRLLKSLAAAGFSNLTGADASPAMLDKARSAVPGVDCMEVDAFDTGLPPGRYQAICSLRFLFHVPKPDVFFREAGKLLAPGGLLVFDTLRWTPRNIIPPLDRSLGGRLHCHRPLALSPLLESAGLQIVRIERTLALPSLVYRFLPGLMLPFVKWLDRRIPLWLSAKVMVVARKA